MELGRQSWHMGDGVSFGGGTCKHVHNQHQSKMCIQQYCMHEFQPTPSFKSSTMSSSITLRITLGKMLTKYHLIWCCFGRSSSDCYCAKLVCE